ncbi:unnamed protein product, partial [Adineta steineri]
PQDGTTDAFNNFLQKRASAVPDQAVSTQQVYPNFQPINNQKNNTYLTSLNKPSKSSKCWPNLLIFFEPTKDLQKELIQKQSASTRYIHKNPWIHLMLSKRIDTAIDEASSIFHN